MATSEPADAEEDRPVGPAHAGPHGLDERGFCTCPCDQCTLHNGSCVCLTCACELPSDHWTVPMPDPVTTSDTPGQPDGGVDQPDPSVTTLSTGRAGRAEVEADRDTRELMSWLRGRA